MPTIYPDTEQLRQKLFVARVNAARRIAALRCEQAKPENAPYASYFDDQIEDIKASVAPAQAAYDAAMNMVADGINR